MDDRYLGAGFLGNGYRVGRTQQQLTSSGRRGIYYANLLTVCQLERDDLGGLLPSNVAKQLVGKQTSSHSSCFRLDGAVVQNKN